MSGVLIISLFLIGTISFFLLARRGAFSLGTQAPAISFFLVTPLGAFFIYIFCFLFIPPLAERGILYGDMHGWSSFSHAEVKNLTILIPLPVVWLLLVLFCRLHSVTIQRVIWGKEHGTRAHLARFGKGVAFACAAYPVVIMAVFMLHALMQKLTGKELREQLALEQLRSVQEIPWLFVSYVVAIIVVVPVIEELLFRGCLQNYLTSRLGKKWGIVGASVVFAFFHYSAKQGIANFGLVISLFLFSCLMGIVYLRQQSLYATIGMHTAFNTLSIGLVVYTS